jgi:hypothetical protein
VLNVSFAQADTVVSLTVPQHVARSGVSQNGASEVAARTTR